MSESPPRLFLVDDHGPWLRALARVLGQAGAEVEVFEHPARLLAMIEDDIPDLVVIDFDLGTGGSGDRLAVCLRDALGSVCPPLVLVSGQLDGLPDRALVVFDAALGKDLPPHALVASLLSHARAHQGARSAPRRKAGADPDAEEKETGSG